MLQQFLTDNLHLAGFGECLLELALGVPLVYLVLAKPVAFFSPREKDYTNLE